MARGRNLEYDKDIYDTIYIYYSQKSQKYHHIAPSTVKKTGTKRYTGGAKMTGPCCFTWCHVSCFYGGVI